MYHHNCIHAIACDTLRGCIKRNDTCDRQFEIMALLSLGSANLFEFLYGLFEEGQPLVASPTVDCQEQLLVSKYFKTGRSS
jgi:hypothetical protein